ncbi:MAG TPA: TonB-dependent receptor [Candidatus Acidoferrum sp.]|nr:TonB-dependent receptor [Candidatus Acidoferrum sp.]
MTRNATFSIYNIDFLRRSPISAFSVLAALVFVFAFLGQPALGQTVTSSLSGTVADTSGAAVPNAMVVLTNEGTQTSQTATASETGYFSFTAILPGTYTLKVSAKGFSTWQEKGIVIYQQESRTITSIALKVGAVAETVEVSAAEQPVPTDSGVTSTTLNNVLVDQIAIQGRDAAELIRLMPGMAMNSGLGNTQWNSAVTQINNGPIGNFTAGGAQPNGGMQLVMDGSVITDAGNQGTQIANINQDMTQEVTIQTSAFDAEHAHGPITFSSTGKSGTSQYHGEGYAYMRNGSLNANDSFFNAKKLARPIDHYWYEGFNVGGPVIPHHNKAFFFFGFEHLNQLPNGALHQYIVPTSAMMAGDFTKNSLAPYPGYSNTGTVPCADTSSFWNYSTFCHNAVQNGQITLYDQNGSPISGSAYNANPSAFTVSGSKVTDPTIIDPNGQILMKLLAGAPGLQMIDPTTNGGYNAQYLDRTPVNSNEMNIRGDFNITSKIRAFATFTRQPETDLNNIGLWWWAPNAVPYPSQTPAAQLARDYSFGVTYTISPTLINEATFGYAYFINPVTLKNATAANPATYSYNVQTPYAQPVPQVPDIVSWCCSPGGGGASNSATTSAGFNASSFGTTPTWYGKAAGKDSYTPDFSDNFTWTKRTHTFKFGYFWARYANVQTEGACCGGGTVGQWEFDQWAFESTNNIYADMLLGHAAGFGQASTNFVDNVVYNEHDFYVQDAWKVKPRLTLHLGVRFEHEGQWYPTNENQGIMVWNPSNSVQPYGATSTAPLAGFDWHGIDSKVPISGWASHNFYADPRIGVAYDLTGNGRTVLRGGFGIYRHNVSYNQVTANGLLDAPLGLKSFSSNCTFTSLASLSTCSAASAGSRTSQNVEGMLFGEDRSPHTQNWNVTIDQQVPWHSILEISYQGSRSRDLFLSPNGGGGILMDNINYIPVGGEFKPDPVTGITYYCQGTVSATCVAGAPPSGAIPDFRPWGYNELLLARHGGYSNYNGLIVQWMKQTGRVVFNVNYAFSHTLGTRGGDNDNGQGSGAALDAFNLANNYGPLAFDRRHIFNAAYVVNLPSPVHSNLFGQEVVNGWKLSGTAQYQSGPPLQPLTGTGLNPNWGGLSNQNVLGTDGIALEPLLTCNPAKGLGPGQYFNPNCFVAPSMHSGQNGPLIWPNITGPAYVGGDLGMYKDFKVKESQKIEFRFTAFNALNHPNAQFGLGNDINLSFAAPGGGNTNPNTTGKPAFTVGRRTLEFALKYIF